MPSSKGRTSSSRPRRARNSTTTRSGCWRTATVGSARSPATSPSTRPTGERAMIFPALFFYLFAAICVASAFMVIASRNPVHSVLFLILAFVKAAALFVIAGAEFLAMILIVVYVGAVAALFLFGVMMLAGDFTQLRRGFLNYLPVGALVGIVFLVELLLVVATWAIGPGVPRAITAPIPALDAVSNTEALGLVLYTRYIYYFQAAGLVLLVAMIGAIR